MMATIEAVRDTLNFTLPTELEAREPPEALGLSRDQVRLLVTYGEDDRVVHTRFTSFPNFLSRDNLVVVTDSATLPAALTARDPDGAELALHLSTRLPAGLWVVEPRQARVEAGIRLALPEGASATLLVPYPGSARLW